MFSRDVSNAYGGVTWRIIMKYRRPNGETPLLQIAEHGGHRELKNSKQETDQTLLTITKALNKTTRVLLYYKPKK